MRSKRRRKRSNKPRYDEHVKAYKKELRKENIIKCRDYKAYEKKHRGEGKVKGLGSSNYER